MKSRSSFSLRSRPAALAAVAFVGFGAMTGRAATIGYWRFEDGAFLNDSSGNGRTLSVPYALTQATLPSSGSGSKFSDPIPQTGAANGSAVRLNLTGQTDRLMLPDEAAFTDTSFTIEAYVNVTSTAFQYGAIASHWEGEFSQRSWQFGTDNSQLTFRYSSNGTATTDILSGFPTLVPLTDYYVAVVVNMADQTDTGITFYLKNLSQNGPLLTSGKTHLGTTLHNSTVTFTIGNTASQSSPIRGWVDEVRYSDTPLSAGELLISVPEPSALALCLVGGVIGTLRRSRT